MNLKMTILAVALAITSPVIYGQEAYSLKQCLDYALKHNSTLAKNRLERDLSVQSKREVVGALLPQINASGGWTRNLQKATIAMPNFINAMLP